ncbi:MAG: hypothetical protein K2Y31_00500 [Burkholderiales bacterium]|jgi:hypothetical protein|nr:hypothetical protein [Burkholderiales bacterium]
MSDKKENDDQKERFLQVVEDSLAGLFRFFTRFFTTIIHVAFRPSRFRGDQASRFAHVNYIGPYTFLSLPAFFSIKLLRLTIIVALVGYTNSIRGCNAETLQYVKGPPLESLFELPALGELLFLATPMIAVAIAVGWFLRVVFTKRLPANNSLDFIGAACYSTGFQYILFLPICALNFYLIFRKNSSGQLQLFPGPSVGDFYVIYWFLIAVLIFWPAICFLRIVGYRAIERYGRVRGKLFNWIALGLASVFLSVTTLSLGVAIAYPLAVWERNDKYPAKPVLTAIAFNEGSDGPDKAISRVRSWTDIPISLQNNTDATIQFGSEVRIWDVDGVEYFAKLVSAEAAPISVFTLEPKQRSLIVVSVGAVKYEEGISRVDERLRLFGIYENRRMQINALIQ